MNSQGWVSLHRKLIDWEWYDDSKAVHLLIHCLLKSNHAPKKWRGETIERGQFVTSYGKLSEQLPMTVMQIRTAINKLKSTGEITVKTTNKFSIISIVNYNQYQDSSKQDNNQTTIKQQSNNNQITTNNNDNNVNNDNKKKKTVVFELPDWVDPEVWGAFVEHRKKLKAPMTDNAKNLMIKRLEKLNGFPNEILNRSIENGWKGVFEINEGKTNGQNQQDNRSRAQRVSDELDRLAQEAINRGETI